MIRRKPVAVLTLLVLALATCAALAQQPAAGTPKPAGAPAASPTVATVGGRAIARAELDQRVQEALAEFAKRRGAAVPPEVRDLVRRQVLESLVRAQLMTLEARRRGMLASEAEGEAALKQLPVFNPDGHFDPARFQTLRTLRPEQFAAALAGVREQLGARKLASVVEQGASPPEAEMRAGAARGLARVTLDMLSLRTSDFAGTFEEPRETQVAAWYHAHLADYRREPRASLTVAFVNAPPLADSLRGSPAAVADWERRMRTRAEELIARVRKGEVFDSVDADLGRRSRIVVAADNFPGYWHGTAAQAARIFEPASAGQVLPEPVRGAEGWLVVRVDETTPAHLAPLREVAREIRAGLRQENRLHHVEHERRALYAQVRDSLAAPGWPIRYAAVDTSTLRVQVPDQGDLEGYFRDHQADYASFDPKSGGIVTRSFAEVRDDVRERYLRDRRDLEGRALADQLWQAWSAGRREPALEARLGARVTAAMVSGSRIDTGLVARVLSDTIWTFPDLKGGVLPYARGFIVWQGLARVDRVTPTFEQAEASLAARLEERRATEELAGARALYDTDPARFRKGDILHYTRAHFALLDRIAVPLTRAEVEKWHADHMELYSAPEMVSARHILISPADPSPAADRQALARAKEILRRIQSGEDFVTLAQAYSEDPATRALGGDLGSFARGVMLEPFEKAAFQLPAGTLCDQPVKTEVGYHIIKVTEHLPPAAKPLERIYSAVSSDAAIAKATRMAKSRADSILRVARTPRAFLDAARKAGAELVGFEIGVNEAIPRTDVEPFFAALKATTPGHVVPGSYVIKGQGVWTAVLDSITPAGIPSWEQARTEAITQYRREAGSRALESKRAELDSMFAAGVPLDSLAAYWGGLQRVTDLTVGHPLPYTGNSEQIDSLLFGGRNSEPGLPAGGESGWVRGSGGFARLRIVSRSAPSASQLADRAEQLRRMAVEQKLSGYFDDLKSRYPVVILDRQLRDVSLLTGPQPPPAP